MTIETTGADSVSTRRRFLTLCGTMSATVGGLSLLSACGNDDVVGAESVPTPTPTSTASSSAPPTYTATDSDRLNFALQLHYLLAAYLQRGIAGDNIAVALTAGGGTMGSVTGGRRIGFTDAGLLDKLREVSGDAVKRIGFLRRTLGGSVLGQPAIDITGGQGSPFDAIARPAPAAGAAAPTTFFDPYASEDDFLLGAVALSGVTTSAIIQLAADMGTDLRGPAARLAGGVAASNAIIRNALFVRADISASTPVTGQLGLFERANVMSDGRDQYDGVRDLDQGLGGGSANSLDANILVSDSNWVAVRRTPEQTLSVLYASRASVAAGGFFPAGVNGVIRQSGNNIV